MENNTITIKRFNRNVIFAAFITVLSALMLPSLARADMVKCVVKKHPEVVTNYFDSGDTKQREKCLTTPEVIITATGEKIKTQYKAPTGNAYNTNATKAEFEPVAAKDVKPMGCSGSGGTVKVNGRVFHLDPAALCEKYGAGGKGSISKGYAASHVKLNGVDANFRKKISAYVNKMARKHNMEPEFIHAVISAESAYKPNATSHAGAMGLMQLMPFTAERFGVKNAYDPYQNVEAGVKYLRILYDEFGTLELAAAGYNAGEGSVRKYNRSIPPFKETQAYVPKVMAFYRKYKQNRTLIALN
ncbi:lytic transglycosylase domain-containing protein [Ostreibacterium oceani]|nr:lytic transglycosylase domain-containing protein [Ostreibacterium oceani]